MKRTVCLKESKRVLPNSFCTPSLSRAKIAQGGGQKIFFARFTREFFVPFFKILCYVAAPGKVCTYFDDKFCEIYSFGLVCLKKIDVNRNHLKTSPESGDSFKWKIMYTLWCQIVMPNKFIWIKIVCYRPFSIFWYAYQEIINKKTYFFRSP